MSNIVEDANTLEVFLGAVKDAADALGDMSVREARDTFKGLDLAITPDVFRYYCQRIVEENDK